MKCPTCGMSATSIHPAETEGHLRYACAWGHKWVSASNEPEVRTKGRVAYEMARAHGAVAGPEWEGLQRSRQLDWEVVAAAVLSGGGV